MHDHHKNTIAVNLVYDDYTGNDVYSKHPRVRFKKPRHEERFDLYHVEDIAIYVAKDIHTIEDELKFSDNTILGVHRCHVEGVDLDYIRSYMNH
jgi:hypothetical protein